MKKSLLVLSALLIAGCGGGGGTIDDGSDKDVSKQEIKPLIDGKNYFEDDQCKDPAYATYTVKGSKLTITTYSDADFNESVETNSYPIISFSNDDVQIKKDGDILDCELDYEITDKPEVTEYSLNCNDANNTESTNTLFFVAYDTKKRAHENKNSCSD